jgi:hypothetical protein
VEVRGQFQALAAFSIKKTQSVSYRLGGMADLRVAMSLPSTTKGVFVSLSSTTAPHLH